MPRRITFAEAETLVRTRDELLATGISERELYQGVASGAYKRLHRGSYVAREDWSDLWSEGRQLLRVIAVRRASPGAGPVFTHASAAVLWELPLYRLHTDLVHTLILGRRHTRTVAGVARHDIAVSELDVVERHGILCTSMTRTVFDMARTASAEAAVAVSDASLRRVAVSRHVQDDETAGLWRCELEKLTSAGLRGVRQARWVTEFADGRAQLPGESVSRLQLYRLGYRDVELQMPVVGGEGDKYFLDFGFRRSRKFGEFDGEGKYLEPELRTAATAIDAILAEKRREDDIRGVTGWGIVRWGTAHTLTPDALGARLASFGVRPPG